MATEANIQESVFLKKGEREENALTSESFEEKATELPGNQVKQLETSSQVTETVNTPLEAGKPTAEGGIFFQAPSVTMVIADEHSNTPESCKAAKETEPEEETIEIEEKAIESEVCGEDAPEKVEPEVGLKRTDNVVPSKKEALTMLEKNEGDSDGITSSQDAASEDIKEITEEHAAIVADIKEQDLTETPKEREFVQEETDDKSVVAQEASEQCETGSKDVKEQKYEESVTKIEQDEEIEEIKPDVEIEKMEQNELLQAVTPDAYISTVPQVETTEHEEKEQDVNALEKDQDEDDGTQAPDVTFGEGLQEKNHPNEDNKLEDVKAQGIIEEDGDVCVSTQTTLVKESIKSEEPDDEKAIEKEVCEKNGQEKAGLEEGLEISDSISPSQKETLSTIEKDQGDSGGIQSSQESPCVDVEETTVQHATTANDFKEQDLNEKPREFIKEETKDKSLDAQEASEECEKEAKKEIDQNPEESVKKPEKEEETEEIKPGVEIEEEKEQNELLPEVTTDVCITTQTKAQVEKTEHEEEDTQNDDGQKEKSDIPSIKEVCEETGPEKNDYEKEVKDSAIATEVNVLETKDENEEEETEQEVNVLETGEGKVDVKSAQDVTFEKDLQEKNHHNEDDECKVVPVEESIEKDTEAIRSAEKTEQQMQIEAIPSDVCISTQTEPKEEPTEKNDEATIESSDGQTNKSEEGLLLPESSRMALNEKETVRKDDDQEKEQEIYVSEEVQSGGDDVTSSENASNEQEQHIEEIKPSAETTEEKDACISTQIVSQEKATENEENAIENDGDQKEKSDNPSVNEVCEENDIKKTESEEEIKLADSSNVTTREGVHEATEETKSSDETEANMEQQGVVNVITTDGCSLPQTEYIEKTTESEKNNDEKTVDNDEGQTDKPESPLVEDVCEATSSKMAQSEEAQGGGDDDTSSQNASNEDIKETSGQHDTSVAYVEEGQGVIAMSKEILIEEAEDKSIDVEELGQSNKQNIEETDPYLSKAISQDPEDEIKKEDKDLSHKSVEDSKNDSTKEEKCTLEQEPVQERSDQDEGSKEKATDLNVMKEVGPEDEATPSASLETSTEDASNSETEKAESESLPTKDLETVPKEQIPELVPKSEESVLKETKTHTDEEKETVTKDISSAEKTEVQGGGDAVTSSQNASNEDIQETMIGQHDTTVTFVEEGQGASATPKEMLLEAEDKSIVLEEMSLELGQPDEQDVEGAHPCGKTITENPEDEIKEEDKDLSHESLEDTNDDTTKEEKCTLEQEPVEKHSGQDEVSKEATDLSGTTKVEPQEEITPSTSLETSTEDTSNSEKEKAESENLPIEVLEPVSEVRIPELVPKSEEPMLKEGCFISETETHLDEEKGTTTEEISSDEQKTEQITETKQETVKEVCEDTSSEKIELEEGLKLSDTSNMKINEKDITFKDDDEEKDQEVTMPTESQVNDNLTNSQIEVSEDKEEVDEDSREIESTVETKDTEHAITTSSSTQIEPVEETIENEEKSDEKAIENDEKEIMSREENLEKKQEDIKETDATTVAYFEEGRSLSTITKEVLGEAEEGDKSVIAQEKTEQYDEENIEKEQKPEEHTDEIKPSVETNEEKEVCISTPIESHAEPTKKEENPIGSDDKENLDNPFVKEVCEESELTKTESEEQHADSSDVKTRECVNEDTEEIKSSDETKENMEQQGVLNVITTDDSSSTQTENIEKTTASEENHDKVTIEHDEKPESPLVEAVCEETRSEIVESEEGVKYSASFSTTLNENEAPGKNEKLEKEDKITTSEVQGSGDEVTSSQDASNDVSATPKEILIEEAEDKSITAEEISLELGEETHPCLNKTTSENPEDGIKKEDRDLSHGSAEDTYDDTTNEEKCTLEHEAIEERSGQDEVSKEKVSDLNERTEVEPQEDITPSISLETSTEDTSNSEKKKAEIESLKIEDIKTVSEVEIPDTMPKSEESVLKAECFISETEPHLDEEKGIVPEKISSDEKTEQTTEIKQETVKEVCEETSSEKAAFEEGLKLSDNSNMLINEKEITFKDDSQENYQEVNTSAESPDEYTVKSSPNEVSEEKENLQEKNTHNEGNEGDFIQSGEGVDEDTKEIKSSVETKENTEPVITTNVCSSTQIEPIEETIEKNGDKAIENDENEIMSREENLEKKLEVLDNDDGQMNLENHEKEQEPEVSELQGGGDDVVSLQNTSNEDTTETAIGPHATTTVHSEEELGATAITKEITVVEVEDKSIHAPEASEQCEESVNKPVNSCLETIEGSTKEEQADAENKEKESELEAENQADSTEDKTEMKDEGVLTVKVSKELGQTTEQNVDETEACLTETISEKTDVITREIDFSKLEHEPVEEKNDSQHEVSKEDITVSNETTAVEPQEDITPSSSLETSAEETSNSDNAKGLSENLPSEDLESVSEVHIPEIMPKSEDLEMKEECRVSATETYPDEENKIVTKEISSDENLETHKSTQQHESSYSTTEENMTQLEQTGETDSLYENKDMKEDGTQETQHNSTEDSSETEKNVILTEEIEQVPSEIEKEKGMSDLKEQIVEEDSYSPALEEKSAQDQKETVHEISCSGSLPVENPEVTEVTVDAQIGQEDLQGKEDISCVSKVIDIVDQEPKEEKISPQEDDAKVESADLSNIESTPCLSESEKLATRAPESDCDVQIPEVVADSDDSNVKEECIVLTTVKNSVEEQYTNEISSPPDKEQENVTKVPTQSDEAKGSDLIIEEKALTKENVDIHGELEPTSEPVIEEDQVTIETKPQPEQSDITSENITNDQILESKLEHMSVKDIEYVKEYMEEDSTLAPENETKSIENLNETARNIILTDEVAVETEKEKEKSEIEGQISEEDKFPTKLDSTPSHGELKEEAQGNIGVEIKDAKCENEAVEDVTINEVLLKDEKAEENKSIKVIINEEAKLNQLTSDTDVCQIESSRPDELRETKDSVEDTEDAKVMADNLSVKDETITVVKGSNEDTEIVPSEVAKIVPECREASAILTDSLPEASPEMLLAKPEDTITEDREVLPSVEKEFLDLQKYEKDLDHETEVRVADDVVSNVECSETEPQHLNTKEATSEFINQEIQREQKKEADESIKDVTPVEDVKTSSRELEVHEAGEGLLIDDKNLKSACESKSIEEGSGIKQEPLELDASGTLGTAATEDLQISQKYVADDLIKASQTHPEIPKYEVPAYAVDKQSPNEPHPQESTESKILTEKIDSSHEQGEPVAKTSIPEAANLKDNATVSIDQKEKSELVEPAKIVLHEPAKGNSEVAGNLIGDGGSALTKDQQVEKEETGVKTDEEDEEEEDNEDDEKMDSCSDAPVMVEASKDMDVKAHKKSHNILSGVGSKVKHSIAKVKKAITGKSSPTKPPSPKAKNQVAG